MSYRGARLGSWYALCVPTRVPRGKVLLTVAIDPDLRDAAKAAAEEEEITLTVFVTRALRDKLGERASTRRKRTRGEH